MTYTREGILRKEKSILNELEWSFTAPKPYVSLVRCPKAAKSDQEMEDMVKRSGTTQFTETQIMDCSEAVVELPFICSTE